MVIQGINAFLDVWLHVILQIFIGVTQFSVWGGEKNESNSL